MRRMVAAATCAVMLGGCPYEASHALTRVGGYTFATGLVIGGTTLGMEATNQGDQAVLHNGFQFGKYLVGVGLLVGAMGLIGMAVRDEPFEESASAPVPERWQPAPTIKNLDDDGGAAVRRRAIALTHEAEEASKAGDCATVKRLGASVRALDLQVYTSVFVKKPDLQRCLTDDAPVSPPVENSGIPGSQETAISR